MLTEEIPENGFKNIVKDRKVQRCFFSIGTARGHLKPNGKNSRGHRRFSVFEGVTNMKGNIFWWRLEGTESDGQYVSPIVVTGGQAALLEHGESNEMRKVNEAKCSIRQRPQHHNTDTVYSLIDPLSFTLKRSDKIIRREMRMTSRSLGRNSVRRESKTLKSCLRLVLLDCDLWRDTFKTASKVKCEAWTREWEKRKSSRVQDISKTHGMHSPASTITLWKWIPEQQLFASLSWRGTPSCVCHWTLMASTATAPAPQQSKDPWNKAAEGALKSH